MTQAALTTITTSIAASVLALVLSGCGHKGPLVAPKPNTVDTKAQHSHDNSATQSTFKLPNNT
ncbi:LPS translocon maturation chaperone LptM [Marinagarivorans algicola]|uniref:LPS translocon maturation chaperone LptM n=1 Tax=Marinagarivorans algicola TaxID=1513270 RepID=UPI0006B69969|nr:lipoprotein [Marinagarivorans algicola]